MADLLKLAGVKVGGSSDGRGVTLDGASAMVPVLAEFMIAK